MRRLLPVAVVVVMMMTSAALAMAHAQGVWSTAQLSVARQYLAAASVGNVALFAGGSAESALLCKEGGTCVYCCVRVLCFARAAVFGSVPPVSSSSLMHATADGSYSNVVDVYNGAMGAWSTAQLSLARGYLAAASVGNVALFAGGQANSALLCREEGLGVVYFCLRVWFLRVLQYFGSVCPETASSVMRATAVGTGFTNVVDVYNGTTGAWSTAELSVRRSWLAAASVGNVVLFGGGQAGSALFCRKGGEGCVVYWFVCVLCFAHAPVLRFCLPCDRFLSHARHCR
jgi:hypothetical protein